MSDLNQQNLRWKLYGMERQGWQYLYNEDAEQAHKIFEEGAKLARLSRLYCMELMFEYMICQVYVYYNYDQKAAVDYAVRLVTRLRQPQYSECQYEHTSIYDILTHAYFYRDCLGYEKEIRESLDYIEENLPVRQDTKLRIAYIRTELEYANGKYQTAKDKVMQYISDAEYSHAYRKSDGYLAARRIMYAMGELDLAYKYAEMDDKISQEGSYQRGAADARMWQAVCAKWLGDDGEAQRLFQSGVAQYKQYDIPVSLIYFDATAAYHELCGEVDRALKVREAQFEELPARGSLYELALAHLQYCRLLGRMGKSVDAALTKARDFMQTLRKPDAHDTALKQIESGDYFEFEWQKKHTRHTPEQDV